MSEINAIAISGTQPLDIEHYFAINFEELNNSINKLSDRSTSEAGTAVSDLTETDAYKAWKAETIAQIKTKLGLAD